LGLQVEERPISIDEVLQDIENGSLTECFGTGTAVVISPVVALLDGDRKHPVNKGAIGPITTQLRSRLVDIQTGAGADPFAWRQKIPYGEILSQISQ
jgi:branched-chain amino acid aminotransferase